MQKVGLITAWNGRLDVFWNSATRKVWIHEAAWSVPTDTAAQEPYPDPIWHCNDDGKIVDTVTTFFDTISIDQIMVFDQTERHGKAADERLMREIYDCEWSDFACEKQVIHFNVNKEHTPNHFNRVAEPPAPTPNSDDEFLEELNKIQNFVTEINTLPMGESRDPVAIKMMNYIMTLEPLLRKFTTIYDACLNMVLRLKGQSLSFALTRTLLQTENFLIGLRAPEQNKIYHANNTEEYSEFLEIFKEYVSGDCWGMTVDQEVIFDYNDMSIKEQLQASILRDKIADHPHLIFADMFQKKKDGKVTINMYGYNLVMETIYRAADETLTLSV